MAFARITRALDRGASSPGEPDTPSTDPRRPRVLPDLTGRLLGPYRLMRRLGEGGMSAVYEGLHQNIGRRAAVKVLDHDLARDPESVERFFNEARAVNIIGHPDIVSISELGQLPDGTAYLVMEYLSGEPLSERLQRLGRLPLREALRLARQIASALQAAHDKGIVHRDLKPDNVMIVADPEAPSGERAKVLDFGIAKLAEEHHGLGGQRVKTRAGMLLGTPVYMAPEQCRGAAGVDARADVYSLGVMLYEMIAGRPPLFAEGEGELVAMHIYEEPQPLREVVKEVPPPLSELVGRMLDKDRALRPTMAQVAERLGALGAERNTGDLPVLSVATPPQVEPRSHPSLPPPLSWPSEATPRRPPVQRLLGALVPLAVVMVLAGAGLGAWTLTARQDSARQQQQQQGPGRAALDPARTRTRPTPAPVPVPVNVRWQLITVPEGAEVVRADGQVLGTTPYQAERPAERGSATVLLRRDGYVPKRLELDLSANVMVREVLMVMPAQQDPARQRIARPHRPPAQAAPPPAQPAPPPPASQTTTPPPQPEVQDFERILPQRGP